ncbi:HAD family acid phosphatase [Moorellaceae bacterium AZ2]
MRIGVDVCNSIADVNTQIKKALGLPEGYAFRRYGLQEVGITDPEEWFFKHPEVFSEAFPLAGAVEVLNALAARGVRIYYVTSRPSWAKEITVRWLNKWGFPDGTLIMAADKARVYKNLGLELFFEDAPEEIERLELSGAAVMAVAQPYNRGSFRWEETHEEILDERRLWRWVRRRCSW